MTTDNELKLYIARVKQTDYRGAGWRVQIQGPEGGRLYRYDLDEDGERELLFDESERDLGHLARLIASAALGGCEIGLSAPAETSILKALARPPQPAATPTAPTKSRSKKSANVAKKVAR